VSILSELVLDGIHKFEYETSCGIISVPTLSVEKEVLVQLCGTITKLELRIEELENDTYDRN